MFKEKLILLLVLVMVAVTLAIPRPDDSEESKDDDDDGCSLPAIKPGLKTSCRAFLTRWTFKDGACKEITYGGCGGTKNLFESEYACNAKCNRQALLRGAVAAAAPSPCTLPVAAGTCRAYIPSFYFDSATGTCKSFAYTGCKGNANNFISIEDCQKTCRTKTAAAVTTLPAPVKDVKETSLTDICNLPPVENTGIACLAFIPSWTFNAKKGKCESYVYGGCGKTANLFKTEEACQATCGPTASKTIQPAGGNRDACLLPVAKGPCFGFMKRYAFNKDKNRCELFTYGGCQGNGNNFRTANECFEVCGGALPSLTPECEQTSCPISNKRYLDRGCRPEYKGKACCPTSFTCPDDTSAKGVCHYGGLVYQIGQKIPAVTEDQPCKTDCFCVSSIEHRDGATIKCSDTVCPGVVPPPKEGCVMVTKANTCCPTYHCHDHSSEEKEVDICVLDGKEYTKGQAIPTGDPCKVCTCVEGFTGLNGPGCRTAHCLVENRVGCVPIYTDNICCPTSYKCAKETLGAENKTRIIRVDGEPGKQGVVTLPIQIPGGNRRKWQVKAPFCLLPKETGPCRMSNPAFYYDSDQLKCLPFLYGGCKGNENRFETEQQCLSACQYDDYETAAPELTGKPSEEKKSPFITVGPAATLPALVPSGGAKASARPQRCSMPMQTGPCRMSLEMFYFDTEQQDCRSFLYGGCKGNSNQFQTVEECRQACRVQPAANQPLASIAIQPAEVATAKPNVCELPQEVGPCRSQIPAYSFNANTGVCEAFWYGGCRGNGNRFETEAECQARCATNSTPSSVIEKDVEVTTPAPSSGGIASHCQLPADMGPCRASKPRFHFDAASGECQPFNFGGCRGNANNFETVEQCRSECVAGEAQSPLKSAERTRLEKKEEKHARCKLPTDVGFCRSFQERFYYDSVDHQCKTFSWGGCLGNANNFASADDCLAACGQVKPAAGVAVARTSIARARARFEVEAIENDHFEIAAKDSVCTFGNETMNLGDRLASEDPCEECICSTPPEITCTKHTCPPPPDMPGAICQAVAVPGRCCPDYGCVSANPPFIDVCQGVVCEMGQHCEVQAPESADGSWVEPVGVCVADAPQ